MQSRVRIPITAIIWMCFKQNAELYLLGDVSIDECMDGFKEDKESVGQ